MTTGKTIALTRWTFVGKVMSLLLNIAIWVGHNFPRSKRLLISWLQSLSAVILEPKKINSDTISPSISHKVMGPDAMILVFWMLTFKPSFWLSSFTFIKRLFSSSSLSRISYCQTHLATISISRNLLTDSDFIRLIKILCSLDVWYVRFVKLIFYF